MAILMVFESIVDTETRIECRDSRIVNKEPSVVDTDSRIVDTNPRINHNHHPWTEKIAGDS